MREALCCRVKSDAVVSVLVLLLAGAAVAEPPSALANRATAREPDATLEPPAKPEVKPLSGSRYAFGAIEFDKATREVTFPAKVNMTKGMLEYLIVHEEGKLHESLLSTTARPFNLNVVLLLLDYQPMPEWFGPPGQPKSLEGVKAGAAIDFFVRFEDARGRAQTVRLESWVIDVRTRKRAANAPWVFNGSGFDEENSFSAEVDGSIATLYLDQRSLLNNPRPGNTDDERWEPAREVPPKGTPVTVILKPAIPPPAK
jgi:hypothetical protein